MNVKITEHFRKADPIIYQHINLIKDVKLNKSEKHFFDLCDHIISQQLSIKVSEVILKRFTKLFPGHIVDPVILLRLSDQDIRGAGVSYTKIKYLKDLARKIVDKEIILERLDRLQDEEVIKELTLVKGIGRWTAEMFLISSLGREDIFSYGDLGLRKAIQRLYGLEDEPTKEKAEKISKCWSPYRSFACKILWRSLESK